MASYNIRYVDLTYGGSNNKKTSKALCRAPNRSLKYAPQPRNVNGTFSKVSTNISRKATRNNNTVVKKKVVEKVSYRKGEVVKVSRIEKKEETSFKKAPAPKSRYY